MVAVPDPDGGSYCVDSTEVTNQHYKAWLDMNPMPASRDVLCEWNTSYLPKAGFDCNGSEYDPVARADHPVVCIDWCDARDFCAWAEKRLCGRIGGGPLDHNAYANETQSQWFRACSEAGARAYPYGDSYAPALCVDDAYDGINNDGDGQAEPVLLAAGCEGGYPGLFGLSGNVWEWEDACSGGGPPQNDNCRWRGGSYWEGLTSWLRCDFGFYGDRSLYNENTGFRCCADVP
jgi:formylglycine-generating enzyme required for sulfatase activity